MYVFDVKKDSGYICRLPRPLAHAVVFVANKFGAWWDYDRMPACGDVDCVGRVDCKRMHDNWFEAEMDIWESQHMTDDDVATWERSKDFALEGMDAATANVNAVLDLLGCPPGKKQNEH